MYLSAASISKLYDISDSKARRYMSDFNLYQSGKGLVGLVFLGKNKRVFKDDFMEWMLDVVIKQDGTPRLSRGTA